MGSRVHGILNLIVRTGEKKSVQVGDKVVGDKVVGDKDVGVKVVGDKVVGDKIVGDKIVDNIGRMNL